MPRSTGHLRPFVDIPIDGRAQEGPSFEFSDALGALVASPSQNPRRPNSHPRENRTVVLGSRPTALETAAPIVRRGPRQSLDQASCGSYRVANPVLAAVLASSSASWGNRSQMAKNGSAKAPARKPKKALLKGRPTSKYKLVSKAARDDLARRLKEIARRQAELDANSDLLLLG